jgi:hypothetical protein
LGKLVEQNRLADIVSAQAKSRKQTLMLTVRDSVIKVLKTQTK